MPSNHLILCRPLLLLPPISPSIRVFSNESVLRIRWPKYWSFSFNISASNEYPGLISFRMDWLDLLAVQGTLKSLQYHSSKASILRHSAFFTVQLSHPYMTTGKTIALTRQTFVGKVMSLLFNMHTLLEHYISCFPSRQFPWVPGAARTPVTQAAAPPLHLAHTGANPSPPRQTQEQTPVDNPHAKVEIKPQLKSRGSVAKEEDPKPSHQVYKLQIKSIWSTGQALCLWNI